jgi:hypothetical protein
MIASLAILLRCPPAELLELEPTMLATIIDVAAEVSSR